MTKVKRRQEFEIIDKEIAGQTEYCEIFFVIHHQERAQILLFKDNFQLPCLQVKAWRRFIFEKTVVWIPKVKERFGISFDMTCLRCIWYNEHDLNKEGCLYQAVLLLESHGDVSEAPTDAKWEEFSHLQVPHPGARDAIQTLIRENGTTTQHPLLPLFARQGWFREMRSWMESQLVKNGFRDIREVKQIIWRYRGTVIQANTSRGMVYLKCSPFFVNEALITETLSKLLPEHVETPIATDVDKRLLLMRDYGKIIKPVLMVDPESGQFAEQLAKIHQATIGKAGILQEAGLKVIPVEMLPSKLEDLLEFFEAMGCVSADVLEQFKQLWPQIRNDCKFVQKVGIPMTLVHGDIALDNVYRPSVPDGHYGIIDWAQTAVSNPFFDVCDTRNPFAYCRSWLSFLSRAGPENSETITLKRLLDCRYLCLKLEPLFGLVRLHLETFEIESPMPVEMLIEFEQKMECLVRTYAVNNRKIE